MTLPTSTRYRMKPSAEVTDLSTLQSMHLRLHSQSHVSQSMIEEWLTLPVPSGNIHRAVFLEWGRVGLHLLGACLYDVATLTAADAIYDRLRSRAAESGTIAAFQRPCVKGGR